MDAVPGQHNPGFCCWELADNEPGGREGLEAWRACVCVIAGYSSHTHTHTHTATAKATNEAAKAKSSESSTASEACSESTLSDADKICVDLLARKGSLSPSLLPPPSSLLPPPSFLLPPPSFLLPPPSSLLPPASSLFRPPSNLSLSRYVFVCR